MVSDPFNVLCNSVFWYLIENFCIYVHQWYWSVISFSSSFLLWLWYQNRTVLLKWVWDCSFLFNFLQAFKKDWCWFFFRYLEEFTRKAIWSSAFLCWVIFDYWCNLLTSNWFIQIFCFFFSRYSLTKLCVSKNFFFIYFTWSNLFVFNCLLYSLRVLQVSMVSVILTF